MLETATPNGYTFFVSNLVLHEFHESLGAQFATLGGAEIVSHYGSSSAEHKVLSRCVGVLDLSFRGRLCLAGSDRARFLHGQVTNDVKGLAMGQGCYAALITAKGKMQSDLNIFCLENELLLDFEPGLAATVSQRLEKFIIADDVQIIDASPHYGLLSVQGLHAKDVIRSIGIFQDLPDKTLTFVGLNDPVLGLIYLMNLPRFGASPGFDLFVPNPALRAMADKLVAASKGQGGCLCGFEAFEMSRIEAGIPRFGADMDETNIPLEAGLETNAISFNKGCYIGQEVISRIRTYGQVAKALRGLRIDENTRQLPTKGDKLFKDGKEVGYITSAAASTSLKATVALGYVRKEVNQVGTELVVHSAGGDFPARIVELPFGPTLADS